MKAFITSMMIFLLGAAFLIVGNAGGGATLVPFGALIAIIGATGGLVSGIAMALEHFAQPGREA